MKHALIIGGTSGIGLSIHQQLRDMSWRTTAVSRTTGCDITNYDSLKTTFDKAVSMNGKINHVVLTAADFTFASFEDTTLDSIHHQVQTNLLGPLYVAKLVPKYLAYPGSLLLFASTAHLKGRAQYGIYSATKSAIVRMTEALADEWSDTGIRINCISPGKVKTQMRAHYFGEESLDDVLAPEEVAQLAIEILDSDKTGFIREIQRR